MSAHRKAVHAALTLVVLLLTGGTESKGAPLVIDDFEDVSDWSGLALETGLVREGAGAGRWADTVARTSIRRSFEPPLDLSSQDHVGLWLHSAVANGAELQLVFSSEDDSVEGSDYYSKELLVDWQGWRWIWLSKEDLPPSRSPLGWDQIGSISLASSGWGHEPLPDTDLVLDYLVAGNAVLRRVVRSQGWSGEDFVYTFDLVLVEPDGAPLVST